MRTLIIDDMEERWKLLQGICTGHACQWVRTIEDDSASLRSALRAFVHGG